MNGAWLSPFTYVEVCLTCSDGSPDFSCDCMQNKASFGKHETGGIGPLVNYFLCSLQVHHLPSSSSGAWDATERGRWFCGCFSGTSHCGPLRGLSTLPEQHVAQFVLKSREEEGNTEAKRQWGLGNVSCKRFNLGCVLQPGEKSKLPDGTLVTILSSLPVWQEVFAAPCFPDDRLLWFDLACFRMAGGWGVHDRELGFGELYLVWWGDVCAVPSPLE